ncbi:MAG: flagellin [Phycisphaerales bacterium]|nr:flagellin [Phycisphaerales bacterium]
MNPAALTTTLVGLRALGEHQRASSLAMERLATGKHINRAKDDPSGMVAGERLAARREVINRVIDARERAGNLLGAFEGGAAEVTEQLQRLHTLTIASANRDGTTVEEREAMQIEAEGILASIAYTVGTTTFNGEAILEKGVQIELGGSSQTVSGLNLSGLGLNATSVVREGGETRVVNSTQVNFADVLDLVDGDAEANQRKVQAALDGVLGVRARVGALMKHGLEGEADALRQELEQVALAESRVMDADIAQEASELVRTQVLEQAATGVIEIARRNAMKTMMLLV